MIAKLTKRLLKREKVYNTGTDDTDQNNHLTRVFYERLLTKLIHVPSSMTKRQMNTVRPHHTIIYIIIETELKFCLMHAAPFFILYVTQAKISILQMILTRYLSGDVSM